jgi:hypothetical protein
VSTSAPHHGLAGWCNSEESELQTGPMIGPLDLAGEIARWGDRATGAAAGSVT